MGGYVLRRVLGAVPLLLGVATLIFFALNLAPGDPTARYFNPNIPLDVIERQRHDLGLDQPLPVRYVKWMGSFLTGDFGYSYTHGRRVAEVLLDALPNTLMLAVTSLCLVFLIGVAAGTFQAVRKDSASNGALSVATLFFYSMPSFWLALMLMLVFSLKAHEWGWPLAFPATGVTSVDHEFMSLGERIGDRLMHLALPVATLTLALAAGVARYTRAQMLDVVAQDYIRTARAKGLPERTVIVKHALRNALLPVITLLGLYLPLLFSGAVFVEYVFAWPGMGRLTVDAIFQRDYPLIMATSFLFAALVVAGNLLADVLYAVADPRIRHE